MSANAAIAGSTNRYSMASVPKRDLSRTMSDQRPSVAPSREEGWASEARGESFEITTWEPVDLSKAMVVMGFPTIGLVGSIATSHLIKSLRLRQVGGVLSPAFPPTAVVHDGVSASPVRIYLGDLLCGPDGTCEQLCVVHSDVAPKTGAIVGMAQALVSWAKGRGARQVVCLEGLRMEGAPGEEVRVIGIASDSSGLGLFERLGIAAMDDGLLTGIGGVALYTARALGLQALCLLVETREDFPDARGAARLLEFLHPLVPLVPIDERPLYVQAAILETVYREQIERTHRAVKDLSRRADIMFG